MKTKTIYHLNHDCDKIVKIEVRQKSKKKKKTPCCEHRAFAGNFDCENAASINTESIKKSLLEACKENVDLLKEQAPAKIKRANVSNISLDLTLNGSHKIPLQQAEKFVEESLRQFLKHISKGSVGHAEFVDFCESEHANKNISLTLGKPIYETE